MILKSLSGWRRVKNEVEALERMVPLSATKTQRDRCMIHPAEVELEDPDILSIPTFDG